MSSQELIFRTIEIFLQVILIILAYRALNTWKKELQGKDNYNQMKDLLIHIQKIRFLIRRDGLLMQIYLNETYWPIPMNFMQISA